jgi:hypothetical protein
LIAQTSAPVSTSVLWLDTDEPAATPATVSVTAPIQNTGTTTDAIIGIRAATTSLTGAVQLTDSVSSTSTTTAATPNSVKTVNDSVAPLVPTIPFITGRYYRTQVINQAAASAGAPAINTTNYTLIWIPTTKTFDRIAIASGATFAGTGSVRLGIYNNNSSTFQPTTVVLDAGTIAPIAASTLYTITISQSLTAGWYWLASNSISVGTTNTFYGGNTTGSTPAYLGSAGANSVISGFTESVNATSGFATAGTLTASTGSLVIVSLRSA